MGEVWEQAVVGTITICIFVLMFLEAPPDIVFFIALTIIMLTGILPLDDVLKGFSNESLITIGALFLVVGAVQKSHVMDYLARKAFGINSSNKVGSARMMCSMAALSAVFNNIPLCNLMIPIVRDWARARGIPLSHLLIPLSYSVIAGGLCTMIGTSTSLIVQGLVQADIGYSFPFFAPGVVAVPASVLLIAYMILAGPVLLPARSGLIREVRDQAGMFVAEVQVSESSAFIANDVGTFTGKLGIQQDSIIKIRRRCNAMVPTDDNGASGREVNHKSGFASGGQAVEYNDPATYERLRLRKPSSTPADVILRSPDLSIELSSSYPTGRGTPHSTPAQSMSQTPSIRDQTYLRRSAAAWGASAAATTVDDIGVNGFRSSTEAVADPFSGDVRGGNRSRAYSHGGDHQFDIETGENTHHFRLDALLGSPDEAAANATEAPLDYRDIINPSRFEVIKAGDIIFIASAVEVVNKVLKTVDSERAGLTLLDSSVMDLPGFGSELIEVVLSDQNPFLGRVLGDCVGEFAQKYKVAVISCRSRMQVEATAISSRARSATHMSGHSQHSHISVASMHLGSDGGSVGGGKAGIYGDAGGEESSAMNFSVHDDEHIRTGDVYMDQSSSDDLHMANADMHGPGSRAVVLSTGDTLLCLAKASDINTLANDHTSFYVTSTVGSVPKPMSLYGLVPAFVFVVMISLVASEMIRMCPAAIAATSFFFIGGWLKGSDIPEMINLRLLMLMGCSVSFAASMQATGLAETIAKAVINAVNPSPMAALFLVYILTLMVTELMSNNAAAALMYPISTAVARQLSVSPIPFAFIIVVAATAAFMSPIGYQTHIMVWSAGGYKFGDFVKFGFVPNMIFWLVTCAIVPGLFPL